jgi:S-adenosylmethionine:tRNA ribosyltransferase-isomerase
MLMSELDYQLPPELIAVRPVEPRDHCRLLVFHRSENRVEHRRFYDLPAYLRGGENPDLLIVNDTRVIPAKLELTKTTGAAIPGLFVEQMGPGMWHAMLRTRGRASVGDTLHAGAYRFQLIERLPQKGMWRLRVTPEHSAEQVLAEIGHVPLPPYIEKMRDPEAGDEEVFDRTRYQTVYARAGASLAAPTAGLHFTPALLEAISVMGVQRAAVDLEVGMGTFLPVETETLEEHPMHTETFSVPAATVTALRARTGRTIVVGTTAVRTLEAAAAAILGSAPPTNIRGTTDLKIAPGYTFRLTDVLITNFHLPRSTLMALVGALVGLPKLHELYVLAIKERYRFYSYGDAMLILP